MVSIFLTNLYIILYSIAKKIYRLKACSLSRALGRFLNDSITSISNNLCIFFFCYDEIIRSVYGKMHC